MPSTKVKDNEPFDSAMRRFKRAVERAGTLKEVRNREFHLKGSVLKQRRIAAARKRLLKRISRQPSSMMGHGRKPVVSKSNDRRGRSS